MKHFLSILLAAVAAAEPTLFTASSSLDARSINANGKALWTNKRTTTACQPDSDPLSAICSENTANKNTTIFSFENGKLSLSVNIRGGQAVYVDAKTGALGFMAGGDFGKTPDDVITSGFTKDGKFEGKGYISCGAEGQISAQSRAKSADGCKKFDWRAKQVKPTFDGGPHTAWQYV